jgi:hypothetical protein
MQKIPFLIFVAVSILILGWNVKNANTFEKDFYQLGIQKQLIANNLILQKVLKEPAYDEYYTFLENSPLLPALERIDSLQGAYIKALQDFQLAQTGKKMSSNEINQLDTILQKYETESLDFFLKTFSQKINGVAPEYVTPERLRTFCNDLSFFRDTLTVSTMRVYRNFRNKWFNPHPLNVPILVDWKTLHFDPNYSETHIQTNLLAAQNSLQVNALEKKRFLESTIRRTAYREYFSFLFLKNPKYTFKKGEAYTPEFVFNWGEPCLHKHTQIWVNNQPLSPQNYFLYTHTPKRLGMHSYMVKSIIENPFSQQKHQLLDTFYYEVVPKK